MASVKQPFSLIEQLDSGALKKKITQSQRNSRPRFYGRENRALLIAFRPCYVVRLQVS
jgi:hypothetical protein